MKSIRALFIGLGALLLSSLAVLQVAHAQSFQAGAAVNVNQATDSTLFAFGQTVNVSSEVNGDVICAGQNIVISAPVHGDVICAGQTITISASIDGSVRLAGQTITIDGSIARNASLVAQAATINQPVSGDVSFAGSDLLVNKMLGRDLAVLAHTTTINGQIGRNISGRIDSLSFGNQSRVIGSVDYVGRNSTHIENGAILAKLRRTVPQEPQHNETMWVGIGITGVLLFLVAGLFMALVLVLLFPKAVQAASQPAYKQFGWAILTGFVASVIAPFIAVALAMSIIGLPLMLVVLTAWLLLSLLSLPVAAYAVGRLITPKTSNAIMVILLGSLVVGLLMLVPIINVLTLLAAHWLGLGSLLMVLRNHMHKPDYSLKKA